MENNSLDNYIKKLLADLDGGDPGNTWDQLSDKMDADLVPTSDDADFDDRIKASLVDLHAIEMSDWENFASSLELAENIENIDQDISIDTNFKKNLEDLQADYDPSTWPDLSAKLDLADVLSHENANHDLDQLAYDSLLNYTVPQRAGDWEAFEEKLDQESVLPVPFLYKFKIAELGILTLLILIFFQANPLVETNKQNNPILADAVTITKDEVKTDLQTDNRFTSTDATDVVSIAQQLNQKAKTTIASKQDIAKAQSSSASDKTITKSVNTKLANTLVDVNDGIVLKISAETTPIIKGKDEQTLREKSTALVVVNEDQVDRRFGIPVDTKELPFGSLVALNFDEKGVQVCNSCFKPESILRWRIGAHLDAKYDYILTAYDKVFNKASYTHSTFGYGVGLSTSILIGKWELESGFDFATRQYETRTAENVRSLSSGNLKVKLDQIQMNVLSIPLNLRYHFKDQSAKTHFYVHAGATLNVATHANYFITSEFINNERRPNGVNEINQLKEQSNITTDKIFSSGWFDGGTYLPNRYYYANLGFGLERKISSRYSIFGQGTYSQYLDKQGIGPNDDRFNTFTFSTGIRAVFK